MELELTEKYKSLSPFVSEELPAFCVITGKNGCGKSQLVELIDEGILSYQNKDINSAIIGGIEENWSLMGGSRNSIEGRVSNRFDTFDSLHKEIKLLIFYLVENKIPLLEVEINPVSYWDYNSTPSEKDREKKIINLYQDVLKENAPIIGGELDDYRLKNIIINVFRSRIAHMSYQVCIDRKKEILDLTKKDFLFTALDEKDVYEGRLYGFGTHVFSAYIHRRRINTYLYYLKTQIKKDNNSVPDSEFLEKYPCPWALLNSLFEKYNLAFEFQVDNFDIYEFEHDDQVNFKLINQKINTPVYFSDLSSGEKVIMGLLIKIFTSELYQKELMIPDLVVLDEPDAHLHPEMSKILIEVLEGIFVNELGINVIITTHSASTVALAPENSIFQLQNGSQTSLKQIDKDSALNLLTENIPTLSIDYENHRQVFVESPTDRLYYQVMFNKLKEKYKYEHELYFISNALGKGNCDQVCSIVRAMRDSGSKTSFGIIDWDNKNESKEFVFVHGENSLYSVENYLYNPLLLAVLFLIQEGANGIAKELSFTESYNPYDLKFESSIRLQEITDWIILKLISHNKFKQYKDRNDSIKIHFVGGQSIDVPQWYSVYQGHNLEKGLVEVFPSLKSFIRKGEGELQKKITNIAARTFDFIPLNTKSIIDELAVLKD
jgi:predicted ATPase